MFRNLSVVFVAFFVLLFLVADFSEAQSVDEDFGTSSGAVSEEIMLASGGTVRAICTGNVPFKKLSVTGGFNNIVLDPESGKMQLNIDIEKDTGKNILNFELNTAFDVEEVLNSIAKGEKIGLNDENLMLSLSSTNKATGKTVDVGNEVRKLIGEGNEAAIDVNRTIPIGGSLQLSTMDSLISGSIKIVFDNTSRQIEKASEVIGEPITIDENGKAVGKAIFQNIPFNGSFSDLPPDILNNLPEGIELNDLPQGVDLNKLPKGLSIASLPKGLGINDFVGKIPPGFSLSDILDLPSGFNLDDLSKIPPNFGISPEDLKFLPGGFNLDDLKKLPPGLMLGDIPSDKIDDLIGLEIPEGIDIEPFIQGIINGTIDPNNLPSGFGSDVSSICQDGMIKPGFESFVPPGFDCNNLGP